MKKFMEKKFVVEMTYCSRFDMAIPISTCRVGGCKYYYDNDYCDYVTGGNYHRDKFFNYHKKGDK